MGLVGAICQFIGVILLAMMLGTVYVARYEVSSATAEVNAIRAEVQLNSDRIASLQVALVKAKEEVLQVRAQRQREREQERAERPTHEEAPQP